MCVCMYDVCVSNECMYDAVCVCVYDAVCVHA
jgi:hypothetical protein